MQNNMISLSMIVQAVRESIITIVILVVCSCGIITLLGTVKYRSESQEEIAVEETEAYALSKNEYDEYSSEMVFDMYAHKEYYNNSILMHVDALQIPVEDANYIIRIKDRDSVEEIEYAIRNIKKVYYDLLCSDEMYQFAQEHLENVPEKKYFDELIYFDQDVSKVNFNAEGVYNSVGYSYMKMQVIGKDSEMAREIMDVLILYLQQKNISDLLDINYEMELLGRESRYLFNSTLETKQRNQLALCAYFYGTGGYDSMKNTLRLVTDFNDTSSVQGAAEKKPIMQYLVIYITMGIILGILLAGLYIVFRCLKDHRIYDYALYGNKENVSVLQLSNYENDVNNSFLIYDLKNLLFRMKSKKLLIASQEKFDLPEAWNIILKEIGIDIQVEDELLADVTKLDKLGNAENVLIICKNRKTTYMELDGIVGRAKLAGIGIQGIVVV